MSMLQRITGSALAVLAVSCLAVIEVRAEGTPEPGPHQSNFRLVNNGSGISEYTGSLNWKYNLLTVPGRGGLDFPINLTYAGNGIGCEQEAGWVGLGFGLNLGSIDRSVVYIPDDMFLSHTYEGHYTHQHDGFLFEVNCPLREDSLRLDAPDMWTLSLNEFGFQMCVVPDSSNIFYNGNTPYGPEGYIYAASNLIYDDSLWVSQYQHAWGLAVLIGDEPYEPFKYPYYIGDRARNAHVSAELGRSGSGWDYIYSGEIKFAYNDTIGGFGDNSGGCDIYVYILPDGSADWEKHGAFFVSATGDTTYTGITVAAGDRFGTFVRTRRFAPVNWTPVRIDYDVEFTDWNGYYVNPEGYSNPWGFWKDGYTPRVLSFTVTSDDGTAYKFEKSDYIKATTFKEDNDYEDKISTCFDYSYKLTSVLSHDYYDADGDGVPSDGDCGNWVRIAYDPLPTEIDYANKTLRVFDGVFYQVGPDEAPDSVWQRHFVHYPQFVETPTHKLNFYLSGRIDNFGRHGPTTPQWNRPKRLDSLVLSTKSPIGTINVRKFAFTFADSTIPSTFGDEDSDADWVKGDILGYHKAYITNFSNYYWVGKLTLLSVQEFNAAGDSLSPVEFEYTTNPHYKELTDSRSTNDQVDFHASQWDPDGYSFYRYGYVENWGYFRPERNCKPGDFQRAWSLDEIIYPTGAIEFIEWESNRYLWTCSPGDAAPGDDTLQYRDEETDDLEEHGGVARGGVRIRFHRMDGGFGTDSAHIYAYGEGVATKPQSPAGKAFRLGRLGNSQEVGYRLVVAHLNGDPAYQRKFTHFTNGSAGMDFARYNDYADYRPSPPVDKLREAFPDRMEDGASILEGVKRGLPYRQTFFDRDTDTIKIVENSYDFAVKESYTVRLSDIRDVASSGKARSIWVKKTEGKTRIFDENGSNPVLHLTRYEYDPINGLPSTQMDSFGNGIVRRSIREYLHDDPNLNDALESRHLLSLVERGAVERDSCEMIKKVAQTQYEYEDFGNDRIFLKRRLDYRIIDDPAQIDTTTYAAYDRHGNLRLKISPGGTKTSYLWGYSGSQLVLEAPNADTNEVASNGFEDSVAFGGWNGGQSHLSSEQVYSGDYAARLDGGLGPWLHISTNLLDTTQTYVFSAWVYTGFPAAVNLAVRYDGQFLAAKYPEVLNTWHRLEIVFQVPHGADTLELLTTGNASSTYFDDIRFHPLDCPMETYAYNRATGQLQAAFDANNVAAERYYYDGFGRLAAVCNPDGDTTATYEYFYSRRIPEFEFDPDNPNYVKETHYRNASDDPIETVTFYDGLGRELQTLYKLDDTLHIVEATFYNPAGQPAAKTKPIEYVQPSGTMSYVTDLVPADWTVGDPLTSGTLNDYYDADGPGPDCHGYPYTQLAYTPDPLRRIDDTAFPDSTWNMNSGRTIQVDYLSNDTGDVVGWDANTLTKIKITDEGGLVSYQYLNLLGHIVQTQVDSATIGFKTRLVRDILGNLTMSIRPTIWDTTFYQYDPLNRLTYKKSPDAGGTAYKYDKDWNLRFVKDSVQAENSRFIYYKYDPLGRKIEEGSYTGLDAFTQANADDPSFPETMQSVKFTYSYDSAHVANGRGQLASWSTGNLSFRRQMEYDQLGRIKTEVAHVYPLCDTLRYTYDWQDNPVHEALDGGLRVYYEYDRAGRLAGVGTADNAYRYDSLLYWPTGMTKTQYFHRDADTICQQTDYTYNPRDWLRRINHPDSIPYTFPHHTGDDRFALELGYLKSFNGNIDTLVNKTAGQTRYMEILSYDRIGRLAHYLDSTGGTPNDNQSYTYDRAGNLLWQYPDFGYPYTFYNFTYYPGTNRVKAKKIISPPDGPTNPTHFEWNANGNLIWEIDGFTYQYTYRNQPHYITIPKTNWTNSLHYFYNPEKRRIKKHYVWYYNCECDTLTPPEPRFNRQSDGGSGATNSPKSKGEAFINAAPGGDCVCDTSDYMIYIYAYDGRLIREYENSHPKRDYLYAGDQRIAQYSNVNGDMRLHYFLTDHLGSTRCLIDSTGWVKSHFDYYPYGTIKSSHSASTVSRRYTGQEYDTEDGINQHYFGARFLHENMLRFTSVDPLAAKYPGWSPYVYALDNPVKNYDPDGEIVETAADIVSVGFSVYDLYNEPSWTNAGFLGLDVACALVPFLPAVAGVRHLGKLEKVVDFVKGADKATDAAKAGKVAEKTGDVAKTAGKSDDIAKGGTYKLKNPQGREVEYVGQTNDLTRRSGEQARSADKGHLDFEVDKRTDNKAARRGREQTMYDKHKPKRNKNRPISPRNPKKDEYLRAGERLD